MKPLGWIMTRSRNNIRPDGYLLLVLMLLFLFYAGMNRDSSTEAAVEYSEFVCDEAEISAYQKVTLGIPVNINRESMAGLMAIPGIGKTLAQTIVQERNKQNGFSDMEDLKGIPGIGDKLYTKITPYISL